MSEKISLDSSDILYSLHFDMYGLIENEMAYDVLLLKEDPYGKDRILLPR